MEASHDFSPTTKTNAPNQKQKLTRILQKCGVLMALAAILLFPGGTFLPDPPPVWSGRFSTYDPTPLFTYNLLKNSQSAPAENGCICPTEMNVLYVGVDNPINVAIPGIPDSRVNVRIEGCGGEIEKRGNNYFVKVRTAGKATVSAAYFSGGVHREYRMNFRVWNLPKPEAKYGLLENDGIPIPKSVVAAQTRIFASLGNSFAYEGIRYTVTRYQFIYVPRKGEMRAQMVNGNVIPGNLQGIVSSGQSGDRIIIDNIRSTGPTGERPLNPIMVELR